jgi:putative transposase
MKKAFKYRIYPTHRQKTLLEQWLDICCELYNAALLERRDAYRLAGKSINYSHQQNQLPEIKKVRTDLKQIHSQVLQETLHRLDRAFDGFFRRVKSGENPGYPRFRSRSRYDSFSFTQSGFEIINGRLALSKIGHIKIVVHRAIEGEPKTCTIKRSSTGKWFAIFTAEVEVRPLPANEKAIGADAGLDAFTALSNGEKISNPHFFRKEEKALAKEQKKLSCAAKGSKERKVRRKTVARVHERIANKRADFAHQKSAELIKRFGVICIEDLMILNMMRNHCLAKSIADAAWSQFFQMLIYKAEWAGRKVEKVPPAHTSQDCSGCSHRRTDLSLSDRVYHCANPECLLVIDRDLNAAINILALGLQRLGLSAIEAASLAC